MATIATFRPPGAGEPEGARVAASVAAPTLVGMTAPLYNADVLRLATAIPHDRRLVAPQGSAERRSPVCGSRITVDVVLDAAGRVVELGQEVRACALGQAAASLMGAHALGRDATELAAARDALAAFLAGERPDAGEWPGLDLFAAARPHSARHASIRLAFEAVTAAAETAGQARP